MAQVAQDPLLPYINKIKSNVNDKDQVLWKCIAATECYKEAATKLKEENERLRKEIQRINKDIKDLAPQVLILERTYKSQLESSKLGIESVINHRLYKKCVFNNLNKQKDEWNKLTEEYSKIYQSTKEELQITNPVYQILQHKRTELKKSRIRCLMSRQKISQIKQIRQKKMEIQKQLFLSDIVNFASIWLEKKKHFEAVTLSRVLKEKEIEWMKKLMEVTAILKDKQKVSYAKRDDFNKIFQIEFSKLTNEDNKPMVGKTKPEVKIPSKPDSFLDDLQSLIEKNSLSPSKMKLDKIEYFPKTVFNSNYSKVRILNNQIINPCKIINKTLNKKERSKALDAKFQKVVQNVDRKMSRKFSSKYADGKNIDDSTKLSNKNINIKMDVDLKAPSQTGATQDLEELKLISQEESEIKFVSQQSQGNLQPIASPEEPQIQAQIPNSNDKKASTFDVQTAYDKLPMSFMGQIQNKVDDGAQNTDDAFKKPGTKPLARNGQFSINFIGEKQLNPRGFSDSMNFNLLHNKDKEIASNAVKCPNSDNDNPGSGSYKTLNPINLFPANLIANNSTMMGSYDPKSQMTQLSSKEEISLKFGEPQFDSEYLTRFSQQDCTGDNNASYIMSPIRSSPTDDTGMTMNFPLSDTMKQPFFSFHQPQSSRFLFQ